MAKAKKKGGGRKKGCTKSWPHVARANKICSVASNVSESS